MAETQNFDKLNILKRRSIPYDEYFGDMDLTPKQKAKRKEMALILEDVFYIFFEMFGKGLEIGFLNELKVKQELTYQLYEAIENSKEAERFFESEEQKDKYITDTVNETYRSTFENIVREPDTLDYTGTEKYWLSDDRAQFIAENESNTLLNSAEFIEAKEEGYTHKIWMSYGDDRVRLTHQEVDGAKIPIGAYFDVGRARMLYPKDVTSELSTGAECPEEIVNCRCAVKYV